jgi:serine/threonine-protein phosphatase PGAM5
MPFHDRPSFRELPARRLYSIPGEDLFMNRALRLALALLLICCARAAADTAPVPVTGAPSPASPPDRRVTAPPAALRTLVFVRHGQYEEEDSRDARVGKGLTPLGVAQARLAGSRLRAAPWRFDALVASPLTRARQTAQLIGAELTGPELEIDSDLEECTPPTRRADVMAEEKPGELAACVAQLDRLAAKLMARASIPAPGRRELYVAHGNVIRYLVTKALAVDTTAWLGMSIGHASLTVLTVDAEGAVRVIAVGDVGHLPPSFRTGAAGDADRDLGLP